MKRNGFKSRYLYRVRAGGQISNMPAGTTEKYARAFARHANAAGAMTAIVERSLEGGGYKTSYREIATYRRRAR